MVNTYIIYVGVYVCSFELSLYSCYLVAMIMPDCISEGERGGKERKKGGAKVLSLSFVHEYTTFVSSLFLNR